MTERLRAILTNSTANPEAVQAFGRFRKSLFVDHLGWQLHVSGDVERDQFDTDATTYGLILAGADIVGGFRALRTDRRYLAETVFPELAVYRAYPKSVDIWEISRFGVAPGPANRRIAQINYALMFRFAFYKGASSLVAIADPTYERYLSAIGITTNRYGPLTDIHLDGGRGTLAIMAGEIPIRNQAGERFHRLLSSIKNTEITDETLVLGSAAVPA